METIDTYRALLRIDKHALDETLMTQPDVMERISRNIARLEQIADSAKEDTKRFESRIVNKRRTEGDSVAAAEAAMREDHSRNVTMHAQLTAERELAEWKGLYEAWKARGYSIKDLVALYSAQYFTANPGTNFSRRDPPTRRDYTQQHREPIDVSAPRTRTRVT